MTAKKRQHYVDQGLQRNFLETNKEKLWVYDRIAKQYREQSTSEIAVEGHLYSLDTPELKEQRYIIEDALQQLEDKVLPVLAKLREGEDISQRERFDLCEYVGFQVVRTPEYLTITKQISKRTSQFLLEEMINQLIAMPADEYAAHMAKFKHEAGIDTDIPQSEWQAVLDEQRLSVRQQVDQHRGLMVEAGTDIGIGFSKKQWVVLHAKKGSSFIGSDLPAIQMPTPGADPSSGMGPLAPSIATFFPFAKDAALLIRPEEVRTIEHATVNDKGLHKFNSNIALDSQRVIFSGSKPLLESIVTRSGIDHIQTKIIFDDDTLRQKAKDALRATENRKFKSKP